MYTKKIQTFIVHALTASILLFIINQLIPANVALGNERYTSSVAALVSGIILAAVSLIVSPVTSAPSDIMEAEGSNFAPMLYSLIGRTLILFVAVWIMARLAPLTGIGVSKFYWAGFVALVIADGLWLADRLMSEFMPSKEEEH